MLYMFQAVFPPIIRISNCTHSIWYMSSLLAATASVAELGAIELVGRTDRGTSDMAVRPHYKKDAIYSRWFRALLVLGDSSNPKRRCLFPWRRVCCVLRAALYFIMWLILCVADRAFTKRTSDISEGKHQLLVRELAGMVTLLAATGRRHNRIFFGA